MKTTNQRTLISFWFWIPCICACMLAAILPFWNLNIELFQAINQWGNVAPGPLWANITVFGDGLIIAVLFFPLVYKRPDMITALLISTLIATAVVHTLKPGIAMSRPPGVFSHELISIIGPAYKKQAFPSGHTTAAFTAAGVVVFSIRHNGLRYVLLLAATAVGLSRILVGVHWPLDVAAGIVFGWLSAACGISLSRHVPLPLIVQKIYGLILLIATVVLLTVYDTRYDSARILPRILAGIILVWGSVNFVRLWHSSEKTK